MPGDEWFMGIRIPGVQMMQTGEKRRTIKSCDYVYISYIHILHTTVGEVNAGRKSRSWYMSGEKIFGIVKKTDIIRLATYG